MPTTDASQLEKRDEEKKIREDKGKDRKEKTRKRKNEKGKERKEKTRKARKHKTRSGSKERKIEKNVMLIYWLFGSCFRKVRMQYSKQ